MCSSTRIRLGFTPQRESAHRRFGVEVCGIPHLAKNERDVGHPSVVADRGREPKGTRPRSLGIAHL
jgi:hypothetical protein